MFYLNAFLWLACMLSAGFGVAMVMWIWRTRPSQTVPAYRRTGPDARGRYPRDRLELELMRHSIDGRRRDLEVASWRG